MKPTTLDNLIDLLQAIVFSNPSDPDRTTTFILDQLIKIRIIYLELIDFDFYTEHQKQTSGQSGLTLDEFVEISNHNSTKASLNFLLLSEILWQFARALSAHHSVNTRYFPDLFRIKFFRDKVFAHWDSYVSQINTGGLTFQQGKAPIIIAGGVFRPEEKLAVRRKLLGDFRRHGLNIRMPTKIATYSMMNSHEEYIDYFFKRLERIWQVRRIPDRDPLVTHLIEFGFPSPFSDVEVYLDKLIHFLLKRVFRIL